MKTDPKIVNRKAFKVAGVVANVAHRTETTELFGRIWAEFESKREQIEFHSLEKLYYGVSFPATTGDSVDYLAGMAVRDDAQTISGCEIRTVPGGQFAVFECAVMEIGATYHYIFSDWLPNAAFELDSALAPFEEYPENPAQQPIRIHIPVRPREAGNDLKR